MMCGGLDGERLNTPHDHSLSLVDSRDRGLTRSSNFQIWRSPIGGIPQMNARVGIRDSTYIYIIQIIIYSTIYSALTQSYT